MDNNAFLTLKKSFCNENAFNTSIGTLPRDKNDLDLMKVFIYARCQEFLGGIWKKIGINDIQVTKPNGGLSNHLYICEIKNGDLQPIGNEPKKIFVRLYGECHQFDSFSLLKDIIVSTILSDFSIGPKLFGIFPTGRLEELIEAYPLRNAEMRLPENIKKMAVVMAQFHSLEMPLAKKPNWLFETTHSYIKQISIHEFGPIDKQRIDKLKSYNLEKEFADLKVIIESLHSQVVFCHNDINAGNILKLGDRFMVIDYEYAGYNYRGFDIGNFFAEMMIDYETKKPPYFKVKFEKFPNKNLQLMFIREYIGKFREISESKKQNFYHFDEEDILYEANVFVLASHLYWIMWSLCQAFTSSISFDYIEYSLARADAYFMHKTMLFPNGYNS